MISIIVATDRNGIIGVNNEIPWICKEDMQHFKSTTTGHPIIMGRKTFDSFGSRCLPRRENIVITSNLMIPYFGKTCPHVYRSLEGALRFAEMFDKEVFVIGGGRVYREALAKGFVDRIYKSTIYTEAEFCETDDVVRFDEGDGWTTVKEDSRSEFLLQVLEPSQ